MSERMRWMVYGKDVIMPKTGKPMRDFFETEQSAREVAAGMSSIRNGRLGVYACNDGTIEGFELVAEFEGGDELFHGETIVPEHMAAAHHKWSAAGSCVGSCLGILIWVGLAAIAAVVLVLILRGISSH